jgi:hypothetical protein
MKKVAIVASLFICLFAIQTYASTVSFQDTAQPSATPAPAPTPAPVPTPIRPHPIAIPAPTPPPLMLGAAPGSPHQTAFASASGNVKLLGLRETKAQQQGKTSITDCSGWNGPVPLPQPREYQDYFDTFGATLNVAASFGDTGANGIPSAQNSIQTEALGQIEFESDHFFYDYSSCLDRKPTLSFGGSVGLQPALVMENLTSATATLANPANRPMFQDAFGWTLGPKVNFATSHLSQLAIFANLGGTFLISQVTSFKQGADTVTATPVANQVGQSAMFWETGVEWKYLNTDIANAYLNKTDVLSPPFTISVGYKHDGRFKQAGDLAGFSDPEQRLFFRFSVGLNKISNLDATQINPGKGYTFKFGIDYERPLNDSRMPTSTRYYLSANFDVLKLFKPPPAR